VIKDADIVCVRRLPFVSVWTCHGFGVCPSGVRLVGVHLFGLYACLFASAVSDEVLRIVVASWWAGCVLGTSCVRRCFFELRFCSRFDCVAHFLIAVAIRVVVFEDNSLGERCRAPFIDYDPVG